MKMTGHRTSAGYHNELWLLLPHNGRRQMGRGYENGIRTGGLLIIGNFYASFRLTPESGSFQLIRAHKAHFAIHFNNVNN